MGFKELLCWKKSLLLKRFLKIVHGHSDIWSSWIAKYLLCNNDIWTVQCKKDLSVTWKNMLMIRDEFLSKFNSLHSARAFLSSWADSGSRLATLYDFFRPKLVAHPWHNQVWNRIILPKYSFTCLLAFENKLSTIDNLNNKGLCFINRCSLCYCNLESVVHLFFGCRFSTTIWRSLLSWMGIYRHGWTFKHEAAWARNYWPSKSWQLQWFLCTLGAAIGELWRERNRRIFQGIDIDCATLVKRIKFVVCVRMYSQVSQISMSQLANYLVG